MASAATLPQADPSKIGRPQPETQDDPSSKFRDLGMKVSELQNQFPEGAEEAITILKSIQKWMTKVAASPQRSPEKQAPPIA